MPTTETASQYTITLTPVDDFFAQRRFEWYTGDQGMDPVAALTNTAADHAIECATYRAKREIAEDLIRTMDSKRELIRHYRTEAADPAMDKAERKSADACATNYSSEVFALEKFARSHGVNVGW